MPELKEVLESMGINDDSCIQPHHSTLYTEQEDEIGAHSSDIISLSLLGDAREFLLTSEDSVKPQRVA
jgi:hypothetical protein